MKLKNHWLAAYKGVIGQLLQWVNLRPEESDRTWLMFACYTATSVGLRWTEDSTVALFLDKYGATWLPVIYIASACMGTLLVFFYSWLQKIMPLRWVVAAIAPCMFIPLFLLRLGLEIPALTIGVVFLLRLWVDAFYVLNDLNTSIAANQVFNIREIKRTYPIISSGLLVADIFSGFSLPFLVIFVGLNNIIIPISAIFIIAGALILRYLSHRYKTAFPDHLSKQAAIAQIQSKPLLSNQLKKYSLLLFAFFGLLQIIGVLIDFQYLTQIEINYSDQEIASFLGIFGGITGLCELFMQLFISSRILEKFGVFFTSASLPICVGILLPSSVLLLGLLPMTQGNSFFWGLVILKFIDELLRYTFVVSGSPLLFQPIPDKFRSYIQTLAGGIAEAWGTGIAGVVIFATIWLGRYIIPIPLDKNWVLVVETTIVSGLCLGILWILRSRYVDLLVLSAGRGQLIGVDVDVRTFKQAVVKTLKEAGSVADKHSCIDLLAQIDPPGAVEILAPLLTKLPSELQTPTLEVMLRAGASPVYLADVKPLLQGSKTEVTPEVFALALRYVWLVEENPNLSKLEQFLYPEQHSLIRATAATLLLRQGTTQQKVTATRTLKTMLTHSQEQERVNAVRALSGAIYLQTLRLLIPTLLQDKSLRVRCAVLEMIAATHLEDYYSALFAGLYYKSTRNTAMRAIVTLENEALPMLLDVATNQYKPESVKTYTWLTIAQIPTLEAIDALWEHLETSKGTNRDRILRSLLKRRQQDGISSLLDKSYEATVERLIDEELGFLGEIYAGYIDFQTQGEVYTTYLEDKNGEFNSDFASQKVTLISHLLQTALIDLENDVKERLLMLLKLLYSHEKMQAARFNLLSISSVNLARGLEILEHTVTLPNKSVLIDILDKRNPQEKLHILIDEKIIQYEPMIISDRLRQLLTLENSLSDWCLACCFHFAQAAKIRLTIPQITKHLRHPTSFVREAAIAYLSMASSRVLIELLPQLQKDSHPLITAQIKELINKYGLRLNN
ncbi:MFS transporter [Calothrix sp. UHCC 0171]|uniref:MFS transporter n=1 Tax=Calothrix sp. UHCC 0171 TaxID=3110245 RepID=UPI002B1F69D1|nr:MFS transporter [Calothrix sp. UHCC 0171]MEA5570958.1 MFS transporter [Calothrix sp. UHCC 0171]